MNLIVGYVLTVGSFSSLTCSVSFRCTTFHYTRSLRSFHQPQHRTASVALSIRCTYLRCSITQAALLSAQSVIRANEKLRLPGSSQAGQSCFIPPLTPVPLLPFATHAFTHRTVQIVCFIFFYGILPRLETIFSSYEHLLNQP